MTIQEQCAERIYELLPELKDLKKGCIIQGETGEGTVLYTRTNQNQETIPKERQVVLSDILRAIPQNKLQDIGINFVWSEVGRAFAFSKHNSFGRVFYDISQDNLLLQSDEFCEWFYQIIK